MVGGCEELALYRLNASCLDQLNAELAEVFKLHDNIPLPKLHTAEAFSGWCPNSILHACDTACLAWEVTDSGMNGLRFMSFHDSDQLRVVSTEVCGPHQEDLSSISKYANGLELSPELHKAYWFVQSFSNCLCIAHGLHQVLTSLASFSETIAAPGGVILNLKTANLLNFEVMLDVDAINEVTGVPLDSRSHHRPLEPILHTVVTLSDRWTTYVIDLAGSQFGIFGDNSLRPQVVFEEVGVWKERFVCCEPALFHEPQELRSKIRLLDQVVKSVLSVQLKASSALVEQVQDEKSIRNESADLRPEPEHEMPRPETEHEVPSEKSWLDQWLDQKCAMITVPKSC